MRQSNKQGIAYEHATNHTRAASEIYKLKDAVEIDGMARAFLDIFREDRLGRETKHIIEELKIMIQIKNQQKTVLAEFIKHANHISEELRSSHPEGPGHTRTDWWTKQYAQQIEASLKDQTGDLQRLLQGAEDVGLAVSIQHSILHLVSSIQSDAISYVISSISNDSRPLLYLHMRR